MSEFASRFSPTRFISFRLFTYTERNCQEHCYGYRKTLLLRSWIELNMASAKILHSVKSVVSSGKNTRKLLFRFVRYYNLAPTTSMLSVWNMPLDVHTVCAWQCFSLTLSSSSPQRVHRWEPNVIPSQPLVFSFFLSLSLESSPTTRPKALVSLTAVHERRREQTNAMPFPQFRIFSVMLHRRHHRTTLMETQVHSRPLNIRDEWINWW